MLTDKVQRESSVPKIKHSLVPMKIETVKEV